MTFVRNILRWYFSKQSLPYWCLLMVDTAIVFLSALFTYWVFNKTLNMFEYRHEVLYSALFYALLSWVGDKLFSTYSGVIRYSSFIDLLHVGFANLTNLLLAIPASWLLEYLDVRALMGFTQTEIAVTFFLATLGMWIVRIVVKALYDVSFASENSMRVLIYGALTGGVGLAKSVQSLRPLRFRLCGFITHHRRARHMLLMGKKVYHIDDDFETIIKKKNIQGILVSASRINDFRNNKSLQDTLLKAGVRIFFAQRAKEAQVVDGKIDERSGGGMELKSVSVEDLMPRSEIKVDMDSVGKMLTGKTVLVTGSAGSIGSELVRQIAVYKP